MRTSFALMVFVAALAKPAFAQEITTTPLIEIPVEELDLGDEFNPEVDVDDAETDLVLDDLLEELSSAPVEAPREEVAAGAASVLRVLDKLTGEVTDLTMTPGETRELGFLSVTVAECRFPVENPAGDAFIFVQATDLREGLGVFSGWMIASAPALNALDHPRYDVWALRCNTA